MDEDDPDLLDEPEPNCWTYTMVVQFHPDASGVGGLFLEVTSYYSSPNVSYDRLNHHIQLNQSDFLRNFAVSPRFRDRFGPKPSFDITDLIITRGC